MSKYIRLYTECNQYYPGDTIRGEVVCQFKNSQDIRKIKLLFGGFEYTEWTVGSGDDSTTYSEKRTIFSFEKILSQGGKVEAREYSFEFEFIIPRNIPSSFDHKKGNITYFLKVTVDRPWGFDYEKKAEVIITSLIRLEDLSSSLQNPGLLSNETTICCFCCTGGHIQLDIMVEKRVLNVGENFSFIASCKNKSNIRVRSLTVDLIMKLTFRAKTMFDVEKTCDYKNISSSSYDGVDAHSETTTQLGFLIPPLTMVPNFTGATLFSCDYKLVFKAVIPGCHLNIVLEAKAGLYHVSPLAYPVEQPAPYNPPIDMLAPVPVHYYLPDNTSTSQENGLPPLEWEDSVLAPPPTYEEASKDST